MNPSEPILRKRAHANRVNWFIYFPGSLQHKAIWLPTRTPDESVARSMLEKVKVSGIADSAAAMRHDAMTRIYWRRLMIGRHITVRVAIDEYMSTLLLQGRAQRTVIETGKALDLWVRSCAVGVASIGSIVTEHVAPHINGPQLTAAYSTRRLRLHILRSFFEWCVKTEKMPTNPCQDMYIRTEGIPQDKLLEKKKIPFTDEEVERVLAVIPKDNWWHGAALLGKHFGLRLSAVANLEWKSLPELKRIQIFTHKGRVVVDEPLPEEVAEWFRTWPVKGESGLCFPEGACIDSPSHKFTLLCQKAGVFGKSFHCLRVRVVTNGINAIINQLGGEERAVMSSLLVKHGVAGVQKIVGHVAGSSVTAARYFNPQPQPAQ